MKIGISISTYANENTSDARLNIVKKCLDSFSIINLPIILVNDGSNNAKHVELINSYNFKVINKPINSGIAKSKNSSLKYFEENDFDFMFLIDDDIEILDPRFYEKYIEVYDKTKISHMCFQVKEDHPKRWIENINGVQIHRARHTNGCMLTVTKKMIKEVGYFKILPYKYGHEHSNYTIRCINAGFAPGFIDIKDSHNYLRLIDATGTNKSAPNSYTEEEFNENLRVAFENLEHEKYISCVT